jgi:chorismate mutase-like protein
MKESNPEFIKQKLKPFRRQIDKLDVQLVRLLGRRFDIVRKVAKVKIAHDIPAFLGGRVDEVRENAVTQGLKYGIDPQFLRTVYTLMIYQSCALEDTLKQAAAQGKKAPKAKTVKKPKKAKTAKKTAKRKTA